MFLNSKTKLEMACNIVVVCLVQFIAADTLDDASKILDFMFEEHELELREAGISPYIASMEKKKKLEEFFLKHFNRQTNAKLDESYEKYVIIIINCYV